MGPWSTDADVNRWLRRWRVPLKIRQLIGRVVKRFGPARAAIILGPVIAEIMKGIFTGTGFGIGVAAIEAIIRKALGEPETAGPAGPAAPAPPATPPTAPPLQVPVRKGTLGRDMLLRAALGVGLGAGAAALVRRAASSTVSLSGLSQPLPVTTPGPAPAPLTFVGGGGVTSPTQAREDCECKKKRRDTKRKKCLERAQISWRSGRYKGKLAGTKCVRYSEV